MRLSNNMRPIILAFTLAIGSTFSLSYLAFGATRSFGNSGRFKSPKMQRQHFFPHPFRGFGVVGGVGGFSEQPVIIIQQFQPASNTESKKPATNRVYVQPRWVDGGHGVELLQPGYWTEPK
jgi:hypothetical protein